ncbi:MAG TPA: GIY-YIG nuclease family protein [Chloroflexota bacterium]|nr:GIY-YIG nuclease family protein [Chloroflexota bacterium]
MFVYEAQRYPKVPGCYVMRDARGRILYVGKAKRLRDRLSSYFTGTPEHPRTRRLVRQVASVEVLLVTTEAESLVLEDTLIKRHRPPYNRARVDEEDGYYYIGQTDEVWPRLVPFRRHRINKRLGEAPPARAFGPYVSRRYRDALLKLVNETYGLRACDALPARVCFLYELGRCLGPCEGHTTRAAYTRALRSAGALLARRPSAMLAHVRRVMEGHAARLEFERAKWARDLLTSLEGALAQQIVERHVEHDQEVVWLGDERALVMKIERGSVVGFEAHVVNGRGLEGLVDALAAPEVLVAPDHAGAAPRVRAASRGVESQLLSMCEMNYRYREEVGAW